MKVYKKKKKDEEEEVSEDLSHGSSSRPLTLLQETARETKSSRPLCRKQEFYDPRRFRGDKFSKP
jgi:hypothetical protein